MIKFIPNGKKIKVNHSGSTSFLKGKIFALQTANWHDTYLFKDQETSTRPPATTIVSVWLLILEEKNQES